MKERVIGCDVGAEFIIAYDGEQIRKIEEVSQIPEEWRGAIFVLEQTGAYGVKWAEILSKYGAVFIADGKDFKRFRQAHTNKKTDQLDAIYLREYYLRHKERCRPYEPQVIWMRALIRQHIRNQKDITKHTNRILQYLLVIKPEEKRPSRYKLFKKLNNLEEELKRTPHALSQLALAEIEKLRICLQADQKIREEILSITRNHPDYEILRTFPMSDIQIACLLAYSWDINRFKDKDAYIGYVCMGSTVEQSGKSYRVKTEKARTEVKGIFYMLYMSAHRKKSPLKPLAELTKELVPQSYNNKKRYIKFLSRFLELTYYARKERTDYRTTLERAIQRRREELAHTLKKEEEEHNLTRAKKIYTLTRSIKAYEKMAQHKDISLRESPQEPQVYLVPLKKHQQEVSDEDSSKLSLSECNFCQPTTPHPPPSKRNEDTGGNIILLIFAL